MKKSIALLKVILSLLYVGLIAVTVVSMIRGGFARTANGMLIPDSWLYLPLGVFLIITIIQAILYGCKKVKALLFLDILKPIAVCIVDLFNDHYVFDTAYMTSGGVGFQANIWNTVLVAVFLGLTLLIAIVEIAGLPRVAARLSQGE